MPTVAADHVKVYLELFEQNLREKNKNRCALKFLCSAKEVITKDATFHMFL